MGRQPIENWAEETGVTGEYPISVAVWFPFHSYVINSQAQKHKPYNHSHCTVEAQCSLLRRMVANECKL